MARRTIKAPSKLIAESLFDDHSELTTLYPKVRPINSNPISTPAEIAERHQKALDNQVRSLRNMTFKIGLFIAGPYILTLFTIQQVIIRIVYISPGDIGGGMSIVFASFLFATATVFSTYFLFHRVKEIFNHSHGLKVWPIMTTIVVSMIGITPLLFRFVDLLPIGGLLGYFTTLALVVGVTIALTGSLLYIWTTKLNPRIKIGILILYIAIFTVLFFI